MTQTMNVSSVRQSFRKVVDDVFNKRKQVVVEKSGIPVAAIISADDLKRFNQMTKEREERFKILDEIRGAFKNVSASEIEQEVDKAVSEARNELKNDKSHS